MTYNYSLTIEELDGFPSVAISKLKVTNGTLTDNADGSATLTISGGGGGGANLSYTASPTQGIVVSDTGTDAVIPAADGTNAGLFLPTEKTKLAEIAAGFDFDSLTPPTGTTIGQTWLKREDNGVPGTAGLWSWTGAYWISTQSFWSGFSGGQYVAATIKTAIQSAGSDLVVPTPIYPMFGLNGQNLIWVEKWASWWYCNSATSWTLDASNSFEASAAIQNASSTTWVTVNNSAQIGLTNQRQVCLGGRAGMAINFQTAGNLHRPVLRVRKVAGTPATTGNYFVSVALDIRMIHP